MIVIKDLVFEKYLASDLDNKISKSDFDKYIKALKESLLELTWENIEGIALPYQCGIFTIYGKKNGYTAKILKTFVPRKRLRLDKTGNVQYVTHWYPYPRSYKKEFFLRLWKRKTLKSITSWVYRKVKSSDHYKHMIFSNATDSRRFSQDSYRHFTECIYIRNKIARKAKKEKQDEKN